MRADFFMGYQLRVVARGTHDTGPFGMQSPSDVYRKPFGSRMLHKNDGVAQNGRVIASLSAESDVGCNTQFTVRCFQSDYFGPSTTTSERTRRSSELKVTT